MRMSNSNFHHNRNNYQLHYVNKMVNVITRRALLNLYNNISGMSHYKNDEV